MSQTSITTVDAGDERWPHEQDGSDPDPCCTLRAVRSRLTAGRPLLVVGQGSDWRADYVLLLSDIGGGRATARTPLYGGPWLRRADRPLDALLCFRAALDEAIPAMGVVSEVSLFSPWVPHQADAATAWGAEPEKHVCLATLDDFDHRWSALRKGRRADIRSAQKAFDLDWRQPSMADTRWFAARYEALMEQRMADDRWHVDMEHFERLVGAAGDRLWLSVATRGETHDDGAAALFLGAEGRAMYLYAVRWGDAAGAPSLVLWEGQRRLAALGYHELNLGGGTTTDLDDPLLRFKRSLGDREVTMLLAARVYDREAHEHAVQAGEARPLPSAATAL